MGEHEWVEKKIAKQITDPPFLYYALVDYD